MATPLDPVGPSDQHVPPRADAVARDASDPLSHLRAQFLIPSRAGLRATTLPDAQSNAALQTQSPSLEDPAIYLCGNSLGVQPRLTATRLQQYLATWATQGVLGHFKPLAESPLPVWLHADAEAADRMAPLVGASPDEVAVMQTLTANLHFLMAAFYRPDINARHKIILESKAFPSDHYAVQSQILHHRLDPSTSMVTIEPPNPADHYLSTAQILAVIDEHADSAAILLLPGIQFYSGQLLDIPTITAAARKAGIFVIWDLAHAVGNVPLQLHDWDVDAAAWCTYKYVNAGPGAIGGLFVHERNSRRSSTDPSPAMGNRLSGWWGSDKNTRFAMDNHFQAIPGAKGFQMSNPSNIDITSLNASLEVFTLAGGMQPLRAKSLKLTAYLEQLLTNTPIYQNGFDIITPRDPDSRGAQLSLRLDAGLLDTVMEELENRSVIVDERRPDVIRVAPAPLYNSFTDVYDFVEALVASIDVAKKVKNDTT